MDVARSNSMREATEAGRRRRAGCGPPMSSRRGLMVRFKDILNVRPDRDLHLVDVYDACAKRIVTRLIMPYQVQGYSGLKRSSHGVL